MIMVSVFSFGGFFFSYGSAAFEQLMELHIQIQTLTLWFCSCQLKFGTSIFLFVLLVKYNVGKM